MTSQTPVPFADADTATFWEEARRERLVAPRCRACGRWIWQPRPLCPTCRGEELEWAELAGRGRVASWTVLRPPVLPAWQDLVPFVVLVVELDEGIRMVGRLVDEAGGLLQSDGDGLGLRLGARVAVRWTSEGDYVLPNWHLDGN